MIKFLIALLSIASFNISCSNNTTTESSTITRHWSKTQTETLIAHVHQYGKHMSDGQVKMILPDEGSVLVIGNEVIGLETQGLSFWFFIDEPQTFKGNLSDNKYFFRLAEPEQSIIISKAEKILENLSTNPPIPPLGLYDGTDEISKGIQYVVQYVNEKGIEQEYETKRFTLNDDCFLLVRRNYGRTVISLHKNDTWKYYNFIDERPANEGVFRNNCIDCEGVNISIEDAHELRDVLNL